MIQNQELKRSAFSSMVWKFMERILASLVSLIVSIILARMLTPEDYSVVGIVTIFFAIANVIISGGFNTALIQKKDADKYDYSSVLYVSIALSVLIYAVLFFTAPYIARIYCQPILIPIIRVMGFTLIINSVKAVLCAYISSSLQFRKFFISTLIGTVISAFIGVWMAFRGYGPWALVIQQMSNSAIDTLILFFSSKCVFVLKISYKRLKRLFNYGWKIFVASIVSIIYDEINPLIIGIKFSGSDLSFYTKGRQYPNFLNSAIGDTVSAVLFPVMSKAQDDLTLLLSYTRRFIRVSTFLIFPLMTAFLVTSDNLVCLLLTDKWLPASPYIKVFCVSYMFDVIQKGNLQVMRAIGRSDLILILEIIKKSLYFVIIFLFVIASNSPIYLAIACIVNTMIALIVNTFPNRRLIGYSYSLQIKDILPNLLTSILMGGSIYVLDFLNIGIGVTLFLQVLVGIGVYFASNLLIRNDSLLYVIDAFHKK